MSTKFPIYFSINLKNDPEQAKTIFEANAALGENLKVITEIRGLELKIDEPPVLGGSNTALNPVKYNLASLCSYLAIMHRALSVLKEVKIYSRNVNVKGYLGLNKFRGLDKNAWHVFHQVEYETTIASDEPDKKIEKLTVQVKASCPVLDIITNPVNIVKGIVHLY